MAKAEYRSSIRSKNLIKKALANLLHEKEMSKITVSDIIRRADISRGTFYAHFPDVHGVAEQIEQEELDKLIDFVDRFGINSIVNNSAEFIKEICIYISNDIDYYRMLIESNILNNFISRIIAVYYDNTLEKLVEDGKSRDDANIYLSFASNGAKSALMNWISGEIECSVDEISDRLGRYLAACTEAFFKK